MNPNSKALELIYQGTKIHYLLDNDNEVMINATEMAKLFGKKVSHFLENQQTKNLIECMLKDENFEAIFGLGGRNSARQERENMILEIKSNGKNAGTWMHQFLAIEFASWLDVNFRIWINFTIRNILFGYYKEHWDAHVRQEDAKARMDASRKKLLLNVTQEDVIAYFTAEADFSAAKNDKSKAIRRQYSQYTMNDCPEFNN
jgi:hypothetical protein